MGNYMDEQEYIARIIASKQSMTEELRMGLFAMISDHAKNPDSLVSISEILFITHELWIEIAKLKMEIEKLKKPEITPG